MNPCPTWSISSLASIRSIMILIILVSSPAIARTAAASGEGHDGHAPMPHPPSHAAHGMLLSGQLEVTASHIVYKQPHHYQVILGVDLPEPALSVYRSAGQEHPDDRLLLILDPMDLATLPTAAAVRGALVRRPHAGGAQEILLPRVELTAGDYRILYFAELPLSLAP